MYFNLAPEKKLRILDYYKNEALNYMKQKEQAKKLKIQDELNYLHNLEQIEQENEKKILEEKNSKKKALMNEYLQMLEKTKNNLPGFHYQRKNKEVITKNWGKSKEEILAENEQYDIHNINSNKSQNININKSVDSFNTLSQIEKARQIIKPIDSMDQFLTDEQNLDEVNSLFLKRRNNKRNYYKNLLFSQHEESNLKNKNTFGTEDILILKQKKKNILAENPYTRRRNYNGFSNSTLENNPILNPKNNIGYNKYFKELYQDNIKEQINNMMNKNNVNDTIGYNNINNYNNNNNNNNRYMNNLAIDRTSNNMAINGSNIINNFDIKKEKLKRNFSGIINDDRLPPNNNNLYYMGYDNSLGNNRMLTNRSMSQKRI